MEEKTKALPEERLISSEERLWIIQKVINAKGLKGLLEEIENKFTNPIPGLQKPINENQVINALQHESPNQTDVNDKTYNYVEDSGMYEKDSIHLVAAEFGSNISKENQITSEIRELPNPEENSAVNQPVQTVEEPEFIKQLEEIQSKPLTRIKEPAPNNPWSNLRIVTPGETNI